MGIFIDFGETGRNKERKRTINVKNIYQLPPIRALTRDQTCHHFGVQDDAPTN